MIIKVLEIELVIVVAFVIFLMGLVAALIGVVDPHSSPRAELTKLASYVERGYTGIRRILDTPIA